MKRFRVRIVLKNGFERIVIMESNNEKEILTEIFSGTTSTVNGASLSMGGSFWWVVGEVAGVEFLSGNI